MPLDIGSFIVIGIFQLGAVLFGLPSWSAWRGRDLSWVPLRRRGWGRAFSWFAAGAVPQGIAILLTLMLFDLPDTTLVMRAGLAATLLAVVTLVVFATLWAPRWALPAWITERLDAGDPVVSKYPPVELRHLMTCRQNIPTSWWKPSEDQLTLPTTLRISRGRWLWGAVLAGGGAASIVLLMLADSDTSPADTPREYVSELMAPYAMPFLAVIGLYFLWGRLRPEDLTLTDDGLRTGNWTLSWDQVLAVAPARTTVQIAVTDDGLEQVKEATRWYAGNPLGVQRRFTQHPVITLQSSLRNRVQSTILLQHLLRLKTGRLSHPEQPEDLDDFIVE